MKHIKHIDNQNASDGRQYIRERCSCGFTGAWYACDDDADDSYIEALAWKQHIQRAEIDELLGDHTPGKEQYRERRWVVTVLVDDATISRAYRDALIIWRYIAEHAEIREKDQLPDNLFAFIASDSYACPLCSLFKRDYCKRCPLFDEDRPRYNCPMFNAWADAGTCEARIAAAQAIVDAIQAALVKLEGGAK